MTRYINEVLYF